MKNEENLLNPDFLMKNILEEDCKNRYSCNSCVENTGCVWCGIKNKCIVGGANGPLDSSCNNSYIYLNCPTDNCNSNLTCDDCVKSIGCGWCKSQSKCMKGDVNKPKKGVCLSGYLHMEKIKKNKKYKC